ncbi:T9SS type A sorting domain-containing protein [Siphonobacter aquaeclarae]|uniref:Por secretion system C-terminal sorting domain-containing protein n=1 Tax=Siphonobacter aquaeclarae TaxID=563176 RepID=A0A1G9NDE6_9BACT|nr:T9SS type A sorting domain-containing protein [Siphonobacter aquaeclarae]SDL84414.1 Por secretion system C-terminal sorting domain-containing protein [Siphonobacter aquaeclarae]
MKRYLFGVAFLTCFSLAAQAQEYAIRLTAKYVKGSNVVEEAVETIVASGSVENGANVVLKAGKAIYLEPGFTVQPGAGFEARIEAVRVGDVRELAVRVFPNPVRTKTTIEYDLPNDSQVTLGIYDMNGRLVKMLLQEKKTAGKHAEDWDATDVSGGTYLYSLKTEKETKSGRMVKE